MPTIFQTKDRNGVPHRNWRFKYIDYKGNRKTATGFPTKEATKKLANRIQTEQDQIRKGERSVPKESDKPRLFSAVVAEYLAWGESQGGHGGRPWSKGHLRPKRSHLGFWQKRLKLEVLTDLIGCLPRVEESLRELQAMGRKGKTLQNYAESLASFCDWSIKRDYLDHDPLKNISKFDTSPVTIRRAPTPDEIRSILDVANPEHRLLYEMALASGLRANELRSLRVQHLDVANNGLKLEAGWTKGRKATFQPLHPALIAKLAHVAMEKNSTDPILRVPKGTAALLYADLKKAGVPRMTADGKLDFHALRTGFTTLVFEAGASVKEAQSLARHSTADLTLNVYARTRSERLAEVAMAVGDRFLQANDQCTTHVQQASAATAAADASSTAPAVCPTCGAAMGRGSNPVATNVQGRTPDGLEGQQVGHQQEVVHSALAASRTAPQATADDCGQRGCTTEVQQIFAASVVLGLSGFAGISKAA